MFHYVDDVEGTHTPANEFTNGDPVLGIPRTIMRAKWPNMIQRELLNLVIGGGLTPADDEFDQALKSVQNMIRAQRIGSIENGPYAVIPASALALEGDYFTTGGYPALTDYVDAYYSPPTLTGSAFQAFRLERPGAFVRHGDYPDRVYMPDMRGLHVRGWANGSTQHDPDGATRLLGSYQPDMLKSHDHQVKEGSHQPVGGSGDWLASGDDYTKKIQHYSSSQKTGGAETRGKNVAWRWIIWAE